MPEPGRILVVVAHPDDVDFGVAGSVATWTDAGIEVAYCIVTDGEAGGFDLSVPRTEMAATRRAEQRAAAQVVGVDDVTFLGYPDGRLAASLELRCDLAREIRRCRPDRVVCPTPERNFQRIYASHPDHIAAGEAALSAVYPDARNPFAHAELLEAGLEPWTVPEVWMMATTTPDQYVDVTDAIDRKVKALLCHVSQLPDPAAMDARIREWGELVASQAGLAEGHYAEAFQLVVTG